MSFTTSSSNNTNAKRLMAVGDEETLHKSGFLENSPSSATIMQVPASPIAAGAKLGMHANSPTTPTSSPSSRLVSFGPDLEAPGSPSMTAMAKMIEGPAAGSRILRASMSGRSYHDLTGYGGSNSSILLQSARPSSPPPQSRSRSRISQSGSMANLMNLVRSKSRSRASRADGLSSETPAESSTGGGWFGKAYSFIRPWGDEDEDTGDGNSEGGASEERKRAFVETQQSVLVTLKKVLGCAGEVALESLLVSGTILQHIPVPYLQRVCTTLISIWKGVQQISMNRLAFLRLTQTCSSILDSIYKELEDTDEDTIQGLQGPIQVLERSFEKLLSVIEAQINTPFLWRYARREDTNKEIASCNDSLMRALALFTNTIQLRTYQAVRANAKVCAESYQQLKMLAEQVVHGSPTLTSLNTVTFPHDVRRASVPDGLPTATSRDILGLSPSPTIISHSVDSFFRSQGQGYGLTHSPTASLSHPTVIPVLQELQTSQNEQDALVDVEELRRSMKGILDTGNDVAILSYLGIDKADIPEAIKTLQRMGESRWKFGVAETSSGSIGLEGMQQRDEMAKDTLHQEFIEAGIDALRRMSDGAAMDLPYWTITPFEIQRGPKIGMGFFSEVFQGKWEGRTVAVKVLSEVTPSDLFIREIKVWKSLRHPNVLKLYGASSATGNPPWFFVSPYMKHGNLAEFLRRISRQDQADLVGLGTIVENLPSSKSRGCFGMGNFRLLKMDDTYRMLQEIAKAMEYLHLKGILHGDLKASNVLVDDDHRCVISDFGQSELKSEVCRITGSSMKTGTLRWKAPELLEGSCMLTPSTDIYAFAVVCIEVLSMGELPWGCIPDDEIRQNVLDMDKRPMIPAEFTSPLLHDLICACWHRDPAIRVPFNDIVFRLHRLRAIAGDGYDPNITSDDESWIGSPYMSPRSSFSRPLSPTPTPHFDGLEFFDSRDDFVALPSPEEVDALRFEDNVSTGAWKIPEPVHYAPDLKVTRDYSSSRTPYASSTGNSDCGLSRSMVDSGRRSPPPTNVVAADARNERRYRYLLEHEFNSSLTLPLWEPSPVQIGDVGYLSKPRGAFVTLFNAIKPGKSSVGTNLGPISGYGSAAKGSMRLEKRSAAQKGLDAFSGFLAFRSRAEAPVARRQSFRLRAGHKRAILYTESAEYHYLKKLDAAKAWFRGNIDQILSIYGREHNVQKEDVFLVISVLQARDHALLVSHRHPNGNAHFNVVNGARKGQPWGMFTCDRSVPNGRNGPLYEEPEDIEHEFATKVSSVNDPVKAVLIGRLRFKPDSLDPTTSK